MGGHQGRDAGVGVNKEKMYFYGNLGAVGLGRGSAVLGAAWGHDRGHQGGDTRVGLNRDGMHSYGNPGAVGLDRCCLVLGT